MSGLINKLSVPLFGLASVVGSGCYDEAFPISPQEKESCVYCEPIDVSPRTEPMVFTEQGTYNVIPGDVFKGSLGVDLRVEEIYEEDNEIRGSYVNEERRVEFGQLFTKLAPPIAFFRVKVLTGEEPGTLTLTKEPQDLQKRCQDINSLWDEEKRYDCSFVSPTEALDGEVLVESPKGYFGKVNNLNYPELAICAAMDLETSIKYTSEFIGFEPLTMGASSLYVETRLSEWSGKAYKNMIIAQIDKDSGAIKYDWKDCKERINESEFYKGNHEVTHLFTYTFRQAGFIPLLLDEGFSNLVPHILQNKHGLWKETDLECLKNCNVSCLENGFILKGDIDSKGAIDPQPYTEYDDLENPYAIYSAECFWSKFVYLYGEGKIKELYGEFQKMLELDYVPEDGETPIMFFEKSLGFVNVDINNFKEWGLGE
ncbi:MAG: hypothetical protein AB1668_04830 [Nanoarchaeota archaeon]